MIMRRHGAPGARQVPILLLLPLILLTALFAISGCGRKEGGGEAGKAGPAAVNDTTAFRDARALADTTARLAAWEAFLKDYPASSFRYRAVAAYCGLLLAKEPARLSDYLAKAMATEKDPATRGQLHYAAYQHALAQAVDRLPEVLRALREDPLIETDACNMVAWDLVERGQFLDEAIAIAGLGAQKAPDDAARSSVLDTQGWAHFVKGEYPRAVDLLEQAVVLDKENPDLQHHLAQAYDKAGRAREALDAYAALLVSAEDPSMRDRVSALSKTIGEPSEPVFRRIDEAREANARPAPSVTLKDYTGKELSLADTKGKVVLLNFWHPT